MEPPVKPLLILDSEEKWRPVAVEDTLTRFGIETRDGRMRQDGRDVNRINFPASMTPDDFAGLPDVGYHRALKAGKLTWHQFWTWWPYNPKTYAGRGEHEGDWELVQFGCSEDGPALASYSQHGGGEKREFWRVTLDGRFAVVYVARDSHANYFAPERDVTDVADGHGVRLDLSWRPFGDWAQWPGRWGNSQNSPGPLTSRRAWKAPHAWHGQARG